MKAIVCRRYGPPEVLACEEVERPVAGDGEVLVEVRAAGVNPLDSHLMRGRPAVARIFFGLRGPKVERPGRDVAGVVAAVGGSVTRFAAGDAVFGSCRGAFAEYACAAESALAPKPASVTFEQAAAAPVAAYTALQGLRDLGRLAPGRKVLANGAAGGVGTFAVQIARWLGAEVTGVCGAANAAMVRSLGAEHVVDYTREDFTRSAQRYDLIFDLVGNHPALACRRVLSREGTYVLAGVLGRKGMTGFLTFPLEAFLLSPFVSQRMVVLMARSSGEDLALIGDLMAAGTVTPVIDRRFALSEAPDAIRYLEAGHARGKIVITPGPPTT